MALLLYEPCNQLSQSKNSINLSIKEQLLTYKVQCREIQYSKSAGMFMRDFVKMRTMGHEELTVSHLGKNLY